MPRCPCPIYLPHQCFSIHKVHGRYHTTHDIDKLFLYDCVTKRYCFYEFAEDTRTRYVRLVLDVIELHVSRFKGEPETCIERIVLNQETQIIFLIPRLNADVCSLVFKYLNCWIPT